MSTGQQDSRSLKEKEQTNQPWWEMVRELREQRGWSRTELAARYQRKLAKANPDYEFDDARGETWLARLERGESCKISRKDLTTLCAALECSSNEETTIMLGADRNIFADQSGHTDAIGEVLARASYHLKQNKTGQLVIQQVLQGRKPSDLSEEELYATLLQAMSSVTNRRKKAAQKAPRKATRAAVTAAQKAAHPDPEMGGQRLTHARSVPAETSDPKERVVANSD